MGKGDMSTLHTNNKLELSSLQSSIRRSGFGRWRYVFNAQNSSTGENTTFFIELFVVNPDVSPNEVVWSDLHTVPVITDESQLYLPPQENQGHHSYVLLRVGRYGLEKKTVKSFFPSSSLVSSNNSLSLADGVFHLEGNTLCGNVVMEGKNTCWQLKMERLCSFLPRRFPRGRVQKDKYWGAPAVRAQFSGEIHFDESSYIVSTGTSFGYIDKLWGKDYPYPFFHLSCSRLSSIISGKPMVNASFVVQGVYNKSFALYAEIDSIKLSRPRIKNKPNFDCAVLENRLHWTVSVPFRKFLIDIDVFCESNQMILNSYSCPSNSGEELQILSGATGTGEVRLYKCIKRNKLELIEHLAIQNVRCEYGDLHKPDEV